MKLDHKDSWIGVHKGITFEICKWNNGEKDVWNYYVYILNEMNYKCLSESDFADVYFHGGCSYCQREIRGLKVGCDYNHYGDIECPDLKILHDDAMATIEDLYTRRIVTRIRNQENGIWVTLYGFTPFWCGDGLWRGQKLEQDASK